PVTWEEESLRLRISIVILAFVSAPALVNGQTPRQQPEWGPLERLLGTWVADSGSGGTPGAATRGGEVWARDLNGLVLIRRDFSEYPPSANRPAWRHEGLMIIAPSRNAGFSAYTFDNEGHVIVYNVTAADSAVVFTSS